MLITSLVATSKAEVNILIISLGIELWEQQTKIFDKNVYKTNVFFLENVALISRESVVELIQLPYFIKLI